MYTEFDPPGVEGTCMAQHGHNKGGSSAGSIDASGNVVGSYRDKNCAQHAYIRTAAGAFTSYDAPGAETVECPTSGVDEMFCDTLGGRIDATAGIVGLYADANDVVHGYWRSTGGVFTTLDAPDAATSGMIAGTGALSINDAGTIAGTYIDPSAVLHGFIYTPATPPAPTTTTLASSLNPSVYLQPVTFTAKVTSGNGAPPKGESVAFMNGAKTLGSGTLSGGSAGLTATTLPVGTNSITASYAGDANFAASKSKAVSQVVNKAKSFTALTSKPNPSSYGQSVTFTATVTGQFGGTPTGTVTYFYGNPLTNAILKLGTASLSGGVAKFTTSSLFTGTGDITASYGGDSNFTASTSKLVSQVVNQASTTTALTSSLNPSNFGQSVTFTATVTGKFGGTPSGSVTFNDGKTLLKAVTPIGGVAKYTTKTLTSGTHTIAASYGGDANFTGSTSSKVSQVVNQASTTTTLTSSLNPSNSGQSVTFTATVTGKFGGTPSGSVTFNDGKTLLKAVTPSGGVAKYTTKTLTSGTHSIAAVYGGDTNFTASTSTAVKQVVNPAYAGDPNFAGSAASLAQKVN